MLVLSIPVLALLPWVIGVIIAAVVVAVALIVLAAALTAASDDADENFSEDCVGGTEAT